MQWYLAEALDSLYKLELVKINGSGVIARNQPKCKQNRYFETNHSIGSILVSRLSNEIIWNL